MDEILTLDERIAEQDRHISQAVALEGARLRSFIRRRVDDAGDAEDILQEVLYELVEAVRLTTPESRKLPRAPAGDTSTRWR